MIWPVASLHDILASGFACGFLQFWGGGGVQGGLWVGITGRSFLTAVLGSAVSSLYRPRECRLMGPDSRCVFKEEQLPVLERISNKSQYLFVNTF